MRAFLSYNVAGDILISGFEYRMHLYLRMVDLFLSSPSIRTISSRRNLSKIFCSVLLTNVFIHAINSKLK